MKLDDFAAIYNECLSTGRLVAGTKTQLAQSLGISRYAMARLIVKCEAAGLLVEPRPMPPAPLKHNPKEQMALLQTSLKRPDKPSGTTTVLAIGDAHDSPTLPQNRFAWIGKLAQEYQPEHIISIGDFADFDSLNRHVGNETFEGKSKTPFMEDVASLGRALDRMMSEIKYSPKCHITFGNHEFRAWAYESANPEVYGMLQSKITQSFEQNGWGWSEYGAWHFINGVGFTHAPFHGGGRPKTQSPALVSIANKLEWDAVMGHTHKKVDTTHEKYSGMMTTINLGTALPWGYIFPYANHSLNAWWWGVAILTIRDGRITATKWFDMLELEERYG